MVARARLLVVDDEPASADQIRTMLGDGWAEVTALGSGADAVRTVVDAERGGRAFDVVLLDYYMPEMGGVDVLREMNQQQVDSRVIIMSGRDPGEVAVEAMRLGAFDFISKPISRAELRLRVERALRDRRASEPVAKSGPDAGKPYPPSSRWFDAANLPRRFLVICPLTL